MIHTGQHFDPGMSDIFFAELGIPAPRINLGIHGGSHGEMTGSMLAALEPAMLKVRPDVVLVPGDTNSTLAGALAAAKLQLPVAHLEAGLRSFNRRMPEEINRVLTDHAQCAAVLPDAKRAVDNLAREGITAGVHESATSCTTRPCSPPNARPHSRILERLELTSPGLRGCDRASRREHRPP